MENNNSVCYATKITEIREIEGADKLELAVLGGWNCVVPKGKYKVGQLEVVATTDAVLPDRLVHHMGIQSYLRKGNRVRTVKLRGVYSECLLIDLQFYPGFGPDFDGQDMMEVVGVTKYEPPVKMVQLSSGRKIRYQDNPNFHVYYKFPNYKNVTDMFEDTDHVQITRKIHGTNARYGIVKKKNPSLWDRLKAYLSRKVNKDWVWSEYEFVVGSHNVEKGSDSQGFYDTNVWYEIEKKYEIKKKMFDYVKEFETPESLGSGITIYGEIYGPGIQKGYDYGLDDMKFFAFDITIDGVYIPSLTTEYIVDRALDFPYGEHIEYAEVLYEGYFNKGVLDRVIKDNEWIVLPNGKRIPNEGVVIKHSSGIRQKVAKCINPEYLIYSEKHNIGDSH